MKTLELNFSSVSDDCINACVQALREILPVPFEVQRTGGPNMRQVLTMPEYLDVHKQVVLSFEDNDVKKFMQDAKCHATYQFYASGPKVNEDNSVNR